jgi:ABC-type multidrug transport system fused ATPase/permease subunit
MALVGSITLSFLDILGVAALVPLVQLATSTDRDTGAIGVIADVVGGRSGDQPSDAELAVVIGVFMVSAFVLKGVLGITLRWWQLGFVARQERETASRLLRAYLNAPYVVFTSRGLSMQVYRVGEGVSMTYGKVVVGVLALGTEAVTLLGLALLLLVASPVAATGVIVFFGITSFVLNRQLKRRSVEVGGRLVEYALLQFKSAIHAIGGVKEIQLRRNGEYFVGDFARNKAHTAEAQRLASALGEFPKYALEILFVLGMALMAVVVFATESGRTAVPTLALFLAAGTRMLPCLVRLITALSAISVGLPAMRMIVADLHEFPAPAVLPGPPADRAPVGDLVVENLTFRYPDTTEPVVRDVSFTVPHGTSLAIVGPSGSGKTTLVDLLLGVHTPTSGQVTVAGRAIEELLPQWQTGVAMVPQDVFWIDDTLAANIAFGIPVEQRDPERLESAVRRAQLADLVASLPNGLETPVGERGLRISGGQRQRVGIARALYGDPQLIMLDEATSALDNETEHKVASTIAALHGDTTLIVVAHRLSTVRHCDQLIFMQDGRIEGRGTFDEVRATNADFARLVELGNLDGAPSIEVPVLDEPPAGSRRA